MPNDLQSFFRFLVPGAMLLLALSPWLLQSAPPGSLDYSAAILGAGVIVSIPLGIPLFYLYFSFFHIPFEKHFMQLAEVERLYKFGSQDYRWSNPCKNRQKVSESSASIWFVVDTKAPPGFSRWLRNIGALLHSLGGMLIAVPAGAALGYSGLLGLEAPGAPVLWLHGCSSVAFVLALFLYRRHYRHRYMQRLQRFIRQNRKRIRAVDEITGNGRETFV